MQAWVGLPIQSSFRIPKEFEKKANLEKRKIYADSTLRHTNQLALSTDVACMSGGGIAQLCNLIPYDSKHSDVVIQAGSNEIRNTDSLNEFVYTVQKTEEKLRKLATETEKVTLVLPAAPTVGPEEGAKAEFLKRQNEENRRYRHHLPAGC